jgi:DNA-directed RNA polymerase subunit RPC12/RpoP
MKTVFVIVPRNLINDTQNNYVCSKCWKTLGAKRNPDGTYNVFCTNENCDGTGFHHKNWVAKQRELDKINAMDAKDNLRQALPALFKNSENKSEKILLAELGFQKR